MNSKVLYIFVEGDYDEEFFKKILIPKLEEEYSYIKIVQYAQKPKKFEYIKKFIRSILSMDAEYIFVADIDDFPCVTAKKQKIQNKLRNIDEERIIVVIKEIESWYLAGLDNTACKKLGIRTHRNDTNNITKEQFNGLIIPKKDNSRVNLISEILKNFSIEIAMQKNRSFRYFIEKYN